MAKTLKNKIQLKLCGFKNNFTVHHAIKSGVQFIGFVIFPPSSRNISILKASSIINKYRNKIKFVTVLVNPNLILLNKINKYIKPDYIQLHSVDNINILKYIKKNYGNKIIYATNIYKLKNIDKILKNTDYLLLDSPPKENNKTIGGSGIAFNWKLITHLDIPIDYFIAGGINSSNITEARKILNTNFYDISSGIENIIGIKSLNKITQISQIINKLNSKYKDL